MMIIIIAVLRLFFDSTKIFLLLFYIIHIRFVFIKFKKFDKLYVIRDINDFCKTFIINIVLIFCNNINNRID